MLLLHHDVVSAASAVAVLRLQRLADEGHDIRFVGHEIQGFGVAVPPTPEQLAEVDAWAAAAGRLGLVLRRPDRIPPTAAAHVVTPVAEERGLGAAWRLGIYRAFWEDGADLSDPAVLAAIGRSVGLAADAVLAVAGDRARIAAFRREVHARRGEGIGGVPVLAAGGALVPATLSDDELRELAAL